MPKQQSEFAVEQLQRIEHDHPETSLQFTENANILTTKWAMQKYGAKVAVRQVLDGYAHDPEVRSEGQPVDLEDLGGTKGLGLRYEQEDAIQDAGTLAKQLGIFHESRVVRRQPLSDFILRGANVTLVLGTLEAAVETDASTLTSQEQHFRDSARYILDHAEMYEGSGKSDEDPIEYLL